MAIITGTDKSETLDGTPEADTISGLGGNDTLNGKASADILDGGTGNDTMLGGGGWDIYYVDSVGDKITEGLQEGRDEVRTTLAAYTLGANIENLTHVGTANFAGTGNNHNNIITGGSGNDTLTGGFGNDKLCGLDGKDFLDGGLGNDTMVGGLGGDVYQVDSVGDRVLEGNRGGTDEVRTTLTSYALGPNVENLTFTGTGAFSGTGNALRNIITGGAFNDTLTGGGNNDKLFGGDGNDTAVFAGDRADYTITTIGSITTVTDNNAADGNDGTDTLSGVERLKFADEVVAALSLADLNGTNGFTLVGIDMSDLSGFSVSDAGDVNGDGFDDVIVGAFNAGANGEGESYVVFGKASWAGTPSLDLATLDGTNGFRLNGVDINDASGFSVSSAGDVNGDGFADLIVGAPTAVATAADDYEGESYVVFGKASWAGTPSLDLATLDGTNGFRLNGNGAYDRSGFSVSSAGDVNGDGLDDVIVGAPENVYGAYGNGAGYVVFGKTSWAGVPSLDLATLDGTNGFRVNGAGFFAGTSVSAAGDVNGDGIDDLIIGVPSFRFSPSGVEERGASYVVFGKTSWAGTPLISPVALDGTNGFRLIGANEGDGSGTSVSSAGDVNADGFDDVIVGGNNAGESYVVFGKASWAGTPFLGFETLDGTNGFRLIGSGGPVSSAGDVNGDGVDDLIVGLRGGQGESYLVYGKAGWAGTPSVDLATLDGSNGFRLVGIDDNDHSGYSVSSAGDVNGDGFADLIIGAYGAESAGGADYEGESYVVFGGNFNGAVTHLGTSGDDTLSGSAAAETFVGGAGNDTLIGNGGTDAFQGGAGDDVIVVGSDLPFDVSGGSGIDTVDLDALGASIDLTGLDSSRFVDIENIDLSGANANTLVLDAQSVFDMTGTNGDSFSDNTLLVKGDAGDAVRLVGSWTKGDTLTDPFGETGKFVSFTNGQAQVLVESDVTAGALTSIDLATLDGTNGFRLIGIDANDLSGGSVSSAGDVNGDGLEDLIVGALGAESAGGADSEGESYVVFGKASWAGTPSLDLATLDGTNGFRLIGIDGRDNSGGSVSSAGDVNGDGFDDVIVGARRAESAGGELYDEGESYVVFGKASWAGTPSLDLATLDGANGFRLTGVGEYDYSGHSVSSAGDVNGDGFDDLIVGAPSAVGAGAPLGADESYVVFGKASWAGTPALDLATLDGTNGFRLVGVDVFDFAGTSVSSAGDVNGDGFDDLIVGAPGAESETEYDYSEGESYVVFGKASWVGTPSLNLATLDGTNGFRLSSVDKGDGSGSVSSAGDVNGDGFDDVIVGAPGAESAGDMYNNEGESYVVFGKASWAGTPSLDLAPLDGINGFRLVGIDAADRSGQSVSSAGDVNGDGFADLIVGANVAESAGGAVSEGESYVVFGKASWAGTPSLDLATLDGTNGFRLIGADENDFSGQSVSSAGDVNGDGFADLIVGAPGAESAGGADSEGESYVIFGGNFNGAVTHLGTPGDDTLTGTLSAETFVGGTGNDTLIGKGGADAFQGGAGDDAIMVGNVLPFDVNGGSGIDSVNLDALGLSIDLSGLDSSRFVDIEKIDLSGTKANILALDDALPVFDMTGTNGDSFADNTLLVKGDAGDAVSLATSWTKGATIPNPFGEIGAYVSYTNGQAQVLVESDLTVLIGLAALDLATLDGTNGFRLIGIDTSDDSGASVSSAGDVNGDGFDDLIVGAPYATSSGGANGEGESYVVFGKANWAGTPSLDLATLDGTNGFRLIGIDETDISGRSVSSAGDVNGDGFADLIIGAPSAESAGSLEYGGESYVVFGKASWAGTPSLDLATLDGTNGFRLLGADADDFSGWSVSSAGDVNGDGFADLIVGADRGASNEGASHVVFGKASWAGTPSLDLATLDGTNGFGLSGIDAEDYSGFSVSSAGDVNGDGFADLIVGARNAQSAGGANGEGESYVVFGKASWAGMPSLDLATLDGINGFRLIGIDAFDASGVSVSSAGDVNGDGFADLIVGAPNAESAGGANGEGESYVVFGKASWAGTPSLDLATLDGINGFRLIGIDTYDASGHSVSSAGDVNGDGFADLIVGTPSAESVGGAVSEGESYVVYGKTSWAGTPSLDLATLDGTNGFRLSGIDVVDFSGSSVSSAGDVNGDGFADLIIGAPGAESAGGAISEGESYVVFGGNFSGAVTHLGGVGDDTLTGTAAAESFVGGLGNDSLNSGGGIDAFQGGAGNDTIGLVSASFFHIDGGNGTDTIALNGAGLTLDLTTILPASIESIERIDITGTGNNAVRLRIADVLDISDESNSLRVAGNAGDSADIGAGWTKAAAGGSNGNGTSTIDGQTYQHYNAGQASLLVDTDVGVLVS